MAHNDETLFPFPGLGTRSGWQTLPVCRQLSIFNKIYT